MAVNYGVLSSPNIFGAFQQGMQIGREQKREAAVRGALAAYGQNPADKQAVSTIMAHAPRLGIQLRRDQEEQEKEAAVAAVFQPSPQAPGAVVDPSQLPPRTDGLRVNPEAMQRLFAVDAPSALKIQQMVYDADAASAKRMRESGEVMASAAFRLKSLPFEQRAAALQTMAPQLRQMGVDDGMLARADLSDGSLDTYLAIGRDISQVLDDDRAERGLASQIAGRERDDARADRADARSAYYQRRSDARASAARAEGHVRFTERDKDRAAIAAGGRGIRTDIDDLGY